MIAARNIAASVRQRLLDESKRRGVDFGLILSRFAVERILSRLSRSPHADRFVLKGAMLFAVWSCETHRPTRDMDLLGFGSNDVPEIEGVFREVLGISVENDGLEFDVSSLTVGKIRAVDTYGGLEVRFLAHIDRARISIQIDIGFGDVITPGPEQVDFPALLPDFQSPRIRAYPVYTVFAEKLEAAIRLGDANGRIKDFYDLWFLTTKSGLDEVELANAIKATFERRGTELPHPDNLRPFSSEFAALKARTWSQFLSRNGIPEPMETLEALLAHLRRYIAELP